MIAGVLGAAFTWTARRSLAPRFTRTTLLALSLMSACTSESKMKEAQQVEAMAVQYTAAWCSQIPARVAAHYTETGSLKINGGSPAVGRAAITASAQAFMSALPDMVVTMDSVRVNGHSAVYHWTLTGTNTGAGGTGKRVHISGFEEWTLDADGRIAQSLGHFDEVEYARQIREGATPAR